MNITLRDLALILNQTLPDNSPAHELDKLVVDSRLIFYPERTLFIALEGSRVSGTCFIDELYERGVRVFLVQKKYEGQWSYHNAYFFFVDDPLSAWQDIVAVKRSEYKLPVIGITGSNGKTIIKEWLSQLLTATYSICKSPKSYNSQIGVPLSVWELNDKHELAIFEAGISKPNEMTLIEKIIRPDIGILTNLGDAHQLNFKDKEAKLNEKLKLFYHAKQLIVKQDLILEYANAFKELIQKNPALKLIRWGMDEKSDIKVKLDIEKKLICLSQGSKDYHLALKHTDNAHVENMINCAVTILILGESLENYIPRFSDLSQLEMRLELIEGLQDITLINDTYNADIESLAIAVQYLFSQSSIAKKSIILSEIEDTSPKTMELIAETLHGKKFSHLVFIGSSYQSHKHLFSQVNADNVSFYSTTEEFLLKQQPMAFSREILLVKGARTFQLEKIVQQYRKKTHTTYLKVHLNALKNNLTVCTRNLNKDTKVMLMLKASGYGLGSTEVAKQLENQKVDYYAVAYTDEGIELRNVGIQKPIMVLNPEVDAFRKLIDYKLEPEIYSLGILKKIIDELGNESEKPEINIHLKLETGMHRLGVTETELPEVIELLKSNDWIHVHYLMTHLAASDDILLDTFTEEQFGRFQSLALQVENALGYKIKKHVLNTGGIIRHASHQLDMVRLGIGLFGFDSTGILQSQLQNAISLISRIAQIKIVSAGDTVGYSRKGQTSRDTRIGVINVGYADGYYRDFGNGVAQVYIKGQFAPTIGNICMDMIMVDITDCKNIEEGDEVELIGAHISAADLAAKANTISYEILTSISNRVQRVYWED
jgi:Alr-MurF fusion protein